MEKRILQVAACHSVLLLCICVLLCIGNGVNNYSQQKVNIYAKGSLQDTIDFILSDYPNYIKIKKSQKLIGSIQLNVKVLKKKMKLEYEALVPFTFSEMEENETEVLARKYISYARGPGCYRATLEFVLSEIYEVKVCQDAEYIYLGFFKPSELYEKVILIDAGHGGIDSGTLSIEPKYAEKEINLLVATKIEQKLEGDEKIKVYLSRENDEYLSPKDRVRLIHGLNPDICISIHCNSAENPGASGVEVLYSTNNQENGITSKQLAKNCLQGILAETDQVNRGIVQGDNIYIIRKAEVPIVLIEIGFLSNHGEFSYLISSDYQNKIADGIINAIQK